MSLYSWKNANKAYQKPHLQPESRKHLGILEKHKDYKTRANDYNEKKAQLQYLHKRALDRNPDEFYYHMINSQVQMTLTRPLNYVDSPKVMRERKIERLQAIAQMKDQAPVNKHTLFVDSTKELKKFNLAKRLDAPAPRKSISSVVEECYKKCSGRMELLHNTAGLLPIPKCNYGHSFYKGDRYGVSDGIGITHRVIKRQLNKRYYYSRLNNNGFLFNHKYNDLLASQTQLFNSTITDTRPKPLVELKKNGHVNISIPNLNISNFDGKISVRMLMLPESTVDSFIDRPKNKFDGYFYKQWMDCKQPERETFQERKRIKKPRIALSMFEEKKETMKEKKKCIKEEFLEIYANL